MVLVWGINNRNERLNTMSTYKCTPKFYDAQERPFYQAIYRGKPLVGYYFTLQPDNNLLFVSFRQGYNYIWDNEDYPIMMGKRCLKFRVLKNRVSGKSKYPKVNVVVDELGNSLTVHLHQIVAQTFHDYPIPDGVTEAEWECTPQSVKNHFDSQYWEANHIDHNHLNFHPDNLEWVSRGVNVDKYHAHRIT
jgi:hypothetical protein